MRFEARNVAVLMALALTAVPLTLSTASALPQADRMTTYFSPEYAYVITVTASGGEATVFEVAEGNYLSVEGPFVAGFPNPEYPRVFSGDLEVRTRPASEIPSPEGMPAHEIMEDAPVLASLHGGRISVDRKPPITPDVR